jgi:hypothetical protein
MDLIDQLCKMGQRPSSVQSDRRKIAHATAKLKRDTADGEEVYRRPLREVRLSKLGTLSAQLPPLNLLGKIENNRSTKHNKLRLS